ncbi:ENTH-domain-containing protein [Gyrodon lividus]|nr:ENTH-domain-containing protein [Gyrodon lividus]
MDRLDSLANTLSGMTIYDLKAMYNQAKNVVLNVSEMEAKVRDATNDEPWGASSTLMQEIAQGTFNFQNFNEIMPCIYARFMEKEARQWRQIYKSLQLLEYLVKHGSERVVDDARSHISTLKMLRNFHYIDDKGKDEGQNVRNRARELVELLSDVDGIRAERRKAKTNRGKYVGSGNDPMSFTSGNSRYGGFGSDGLGGGSGYYGDRMSGRDDYHAGGSSGGFRDSAGQRDFEEYNAGDDETVVRRSNSVSRSSIPSRSATTAGSSLRTQTASAPPPPKPKEPEPDLLGGFGEDQPPATAPTISNNTNTNKALPSLAGFDDDDFADFQAAPSPSSPPARPTLMEMLNSSPPQASRVSAATMSAPLTSSQVPRATSPPGFNASFNMLSPTAHRQSQTFTRAPAAPVQNNLWASSQPLSPTTSTVLTRPFTSAAPSRVPISGAPSPTPAKGLSGFDDLWSMSLGASSPTSAGKSTTAGKSIKDLEKEKAQAGIWASTQKPGPAIGAAMGAGMGSGLGNFGVASPPNGGDDLLL